MHVRHVHMHVHVIMCMPSSTGPLDVTIIIRLRGSSTSEPRSCNYSPRVKQTRRLKRSCPHVHRLAVWQPTLLPDLRCHVLIPQAAP